MFYFIVSRIPMISNVDEGKFLRIFIIGTICYVILHAFLYSKYNENISFITNYRSYLYYLWAADIVLTGILVKFFGSNNTSDENIELSDSENEKLSDKVAQKLENMAKGTSSSSPFISKDQLSQLNSQKQMVQRQIAEQQLLQQQFIQQQIAQQQIAQQQIAQQQMQKNPPDTSLLNNDTKTNSFDDKDDQNDQKKQDTIEQYSDTDIPMFNR